MSSLIKPFVLVLAALSGMTFSTAPAFAKDITAEEAARRVNMAGRQRMLSQRIAMSACFATVGINSRTQYQVLENAYHEFSQVHDGLRNGSEELDLHQEGYRSVVDALNAVDTSWADYQAMIDGILKIKLMTPYVMNRFDDNGVAVLNDMNVAVTTIASKYSAELEELPQILAVTIDFAGRQRMLTQKMAKEFCMVSAGVDVEESRELLMQSYEQFNLTLAALVDGIPHMITPAPTPEILAHLHDVEKVWEQPSQIFAKAIAGEEITLEDRRFIADNIDTVLMKMNDTALLYQDVHGLPNF